MRCAIYMRIEDGSITESEIPIGFRMTRTHVRWSTSRRWQRYIELGKLAVNTKPSCQLDILKRDFIYASENSNDQIVSSSNS